MSKTSDAGIGRPASPSQLVDAPNVLPPFCGGREINVQPGVACNSLINSMSSKATMRGTCIVRISLKSNDGQLVYYNFERTQRGVVYFDLQAVAGGHVS